MNYGDGTSIQMADRLEVKEEDFEPEEAEVIKIGKKKIRIEWVNTHIKQRTAWVDPGQCELIARDG